MSSSRCNAALPNTKLLQQLLLLCIVCRGGDKLLTPQRKTRPLRYRFYDGVLHAARSSALFLLSLLQVPARHRPTFHCPILYWGRMPQLSNPGPRQATLQIPRRSFPLNIAPLESTKETHLRSTSCRASTAPTTTTTATTTSRMVSLAESRCQELQNKSLEEQWGRGGAFRGFRRPSQPLFGSSPNTSSIGSDLSHFHSDLSTSHKIRVVVLIRGPPERGDCPQSRTAQRNTDANLQTSQRPSEL